ncbi:MAG: DNA adenine methylase [Candidatus Baldrarchaeia archaeon]
MRESYNRLLDEYIKHSNGNMNANTFCVTIRTSKTGVMIFQELMRMGIQIAEELESKGLKPVGEFHIDIIEEEYKPRGGKILAFRMYGGKFSHLNWLLPLLPKTKVYVEPFAGSAAVLLNKEPAEIEVLNDIDGDIVNFFKVLRDRPADLIKALYLTPFSREEFIKAWKMRGRKDLDDVERARLFFVRAEQVRIGLVQTATPGRWAWCKLTSRRGMSGAVSRWLNRIEALWLVAERLRRVQIENDDAFNVIPRYDSEETLFYCDPPYPHETRGDTRAYGYEFSETQHKRLAKLLRSVKGLVAISGYRSPLMDELYEDWIRIDAPTIAHSVKESRTESLWINYPLEIIGNETINKLKKMGIRIHIPKK